MVQYFYIITKVCHLSRIQCTPKTVATAGADTGGGCDNESNMQLLLRLTFNHSKIERYKK